MSHDKGQPPRKTEVPHEFSRLAQELIGDMRGVAFREPFQMRRRPTRDLAPLMDELLARHHIGQTTLEDGIREQWAGIVGQANAQYSHPLNVDDKNILHIVYSHAMVRSNLVLAKPGILTKLRALPRCSMIRDIRFQLGGG